MALVQDSFNRANSATTLGTTDSGQAWSTLQGTWGISSNKAYDVSATDGDMAIITAPSTPTWFQVGITGLPTSGISSAGIAGWVTDINNFYLVQLNVATTGFDSLDLYKRVGGTYTLLAQLGGSSIPSNPYTIALRLLANSQKAFLNGVGKLSATDSALSSTAKCGIRQGGAVTTPRWDDFLCDPWMHFPRRGAMSQAVHRAAHYFNRVPWRERIGGLLVPTDADRRLVAGV